MMQTQRLSALRFDSRKERPQAVEEALAVEAALELRINETPFTTTMRTPGDERALARGLLLTEGIVPDLRAPLDWREVADPETGFVARLDISVDAQWIARPFESRRAQMATSSCGFCGTREARDLAIADDAPRLAPADFDITQAPGFFAAMRAGQRGFAETGGSHAAALFDCRGKTLAVCEDVGRHNAVDKAVGTLALHGTLREARVLAVSGRVSYEIVYKAFQARVPVLLAVSAPTSLAVETARRCGMTLIGFCRETRGTLYAGVALDEMTV